MGCQGIVLAGTWMTGQIQSRLVIGMGKPLLAMGWGVGALDGTAVEARLDLKDLQRRGRWTVGVSVSIKCPVPSLLGALVKREEREPDLQFPSIPSLHMSTLWSGHWSLQAPSASVKNSHTTPEFPDQFRDWHLPESPVLVVCM